MPPQPPPYQEPLLGSTLPIPLPQLQNQSLKLSPPIQSTDLTNLSDKDLRKMLELSEQNLSDEELQKKLQETEQKLENSDFLPFCREILRLRTPRHYQEWWEIASDKRRVLVEAHRDSWKSFFWSRSYPLYRAISRPGVSICLVSYSETQSRKNIYWIKQMLETVPDLRKFVPTSGSFTWQKTFLHFTNGSTIESRGFGSALRGGHFDYIICDDILKDGTSISHDDQENFFFGVVTPACRKTGQICVIGTPLEYGDLLEKLEKSETYSFHRYPAVVNGKIWFDEEYDQTTIERWKKESPNYWYFAREYLLQRINPDKASFKPSWIVYYEKREVEDKKLFKVMTLDPALTEKGDYNGIVVTGTDQFNTTYVLDSCKMRGQLSSIIDKVFSLIEKHEPDIVGCEMFGFQKFLKFWIEQEMIKRNRFFHIQQLEAGQKKSKPMRILGLQPKIEAGKVKFRKEEDQELVEELLAFDFTRRDNEDDVIDSMAYQVSLWRPPTRERKQAETEGSFDKVVEHMDEQSDAEGGQGYIKQVFSDFNHGDDEEPMFTSL